MERNGVPSASGAAPSLQAGSQHRSRRRHSRREQPGHPERAEGPDDSDVHQHEEVDGERIEQRRAERDQPRHEIGPPRREPAPERPAATLTDHERLLTVVRRDVGREPRLDGREHGVRAADVETHAGGLGAKVRGAQRASHGPEGRVARHVTGDEEDGAPAAVRQADARRDRIAAKRDELWERAALAPDRRRTPQPLHRELSNRRPPQRAGAAGADGGYCRVTHPDCLLLGPPDPRV